jgi:hypothetical protein
MSEFNREEAMRQGRAGMGRVADANPVFSIQFGQYLDRLPRGWEGTCEDIRRIWKGVRPKHPNAWGSCWGAAKRRGVLVELHKQVHMTAVRSHGRKTHIYRKA